MNSTELNALARRQINCQMSLGSSIHEMSDFIVTLTSARFIGSGFRVDL